MPSEMKFLIDKIHESPTTDEMVDYCIRLITKHGNAINIVPKYRDADLWRNYTAFEPGENTTIFLILRKYGHKFIVMNVNGNIKFYFWELLPNVVRVG